MIGMRTTGGRQAQCAGLFPDDSGFLTSKVLNPPLVAIVSLEVNQRELGLEVNQRTLNLEVVAPG